MGENQGTPGKPGQQGGDQLVLPHRVGKHEMNQVGTPRQAQQPGVIRKPLQIDPLDRVVQLGKLLASELNPLELGQGRQ